MKIYVPQKDVKIATCKTWSEIFSNGIDKRLWLYFIEYKNKTKSL